MHSEGRAQLRSGCLGSSGLEQDSVAVTSHICVPRCGTDPSGQPDCDHSAAGFPEGPVERTLLVGGHRCVTPPAGLLRVVTPCGSQVGPRGLLVVTKGSANCCAPNPWDPDTQCTALCYFPAVVGPVWQWYSLGCQPCARLGEGAWGLAVLGAVPLGKRVPLCWTVVQTCQAVAPAPVTRPPAASTVNAALMLSLSFLSADQALDRFAMKKFYDDKVSALMQPSQKRYVCVPEPETRAR